PNAGDLLDEIAEEVLRTKGTVVVVPRERMPTETGLAAIFRFTPGAERITAAKSHHGERCASIPVYPHQSARQKAALAGDQRNPRSLLHADGTALSRGHSPNGG